MANGFQNPYITETEFDPRIDTTLSVQSWVENPKYTGDPYGDELPMKTYTRDVDLDVALSDLGYTGIKGYEYSGLGDQTMRALEDVFGGGVSAFDYIDPTQGLYTGTSSEAGDAAAQFDLVRSMADYLIDEGEHSGYRHYGGYGVGVMPTDVESLKFESALPMVNIFDQASIAKALGVDASEVRALDAKMFDKMGSEHYEPLVENVREGATLDLAKALAPDVTGGFAGSSAVASRDAQARRAYDKEMRTILGEILKSRAKASQDVSSRIYDWQEIA
tara:strand:+ start:171 stop:998 length:828 start_codon:yes stop_codon:yes gene_type:complete